MSLRLAEKRGLIFFQPEVGDEVVVMFEDGDPERPVILGCVWNGVDAAPTQRPDHSHAKDYEPLAHQLAERYPGLDLFSAGYLKEQLGLEQYMRSPNWLTAVGDEFLERLGGIDAVSRDMSTEIIRYRYPGGVIFQAGAKPDIEEGKIPPLYRQVARALKPVRIPENQRSYFTPDMLKSFARFD